MDLSFTDEQQQLRQSAQRYLGQQYDFAQRQQALAAPVGVARRHWREFAELGWLALPFDAALGGLGGNSIDLHVLAETFGAALVVEPYVPTVILAGLVIDAVGAAVHREPMIAQIAAGQLQLALAHEEPAQRLAPIARATPQTRAIPTSNGWQLSGTKTNVLGAPGAQTLIVSAALANETAQPDASAACTALFLVRTDAPGVHLRSVELIDGQRAAQIELDSVRVTPLDRLDDAAADARAASRRCEAAIERARLRAMIFDASQAVGSMQALLDATLAYVKTRVQFGQPLSANQVIRHRLVDMAIACEEARAIALRAAIAFAADDAGNGAGDGSSVAGLDHGTADANDDARRIAAAAARIKIVRGARLVAEQAVQLHGGMGVTEELNIGAYFKSLLAFELRHGAGELAQRAQYERLRARAARQAAQERQQAQARRSRQAGQTTQERA